MKEYFMKKSNYFGLALLYLGFILIGKVVYFDVWRGVNTTEVLVAFSFLPLFVKIFVIIIMLFMTLLLYSLQTDTGTLLFNLRGFIALIIFCFTGFLTGFLIINYELLESSRLFVLWFGILIFLVGFLTDLRITNKKI